ncbi:MAG: protein GlmU [Desulfatibacillaceae bacterium]
MATLAQLMERGVTIHAPESVYVGPEVRLERVADKGVVIWPGCRVTGADTLLMEGVELGREAPVTVDECQLGPEVSLAGGSVKRSVFLRGASMGSGAQVRDGTILEEFARGAHTVGLKQTILFPWVTLGSLVNFCDVLMTGGTGDRDHSEVGSSYIHFNYTPQQDKATPSLVGNVPEGVFLNQRPIFLGGQGGMVGPRRLAHGTVAAAGTIVRKDELKKNRLVFDRPAGRGSVSFDPGVYRSVAAVFKNNVMYLANLVALRQWYIHVRSRFIAGDLEQALHDGLCDKLDMAREERVKRLQAFCNRMPESARRLSGLSETAGAEKLLARKRELHARWADARAWYQTRWAETGILGDGESFLEGFENARLASPADYLATVRRLPAGTARTGRDWLSGVVDEVADGMLGFFPSLD